MPFTYNGIGTRYHGKQNVEIRPGRCRSCGRQVQLESYDTRLFFVIVYIPIIPLGRKRILDFCPACRRHYASDLHKWETARQLETSGAMDNYRSNPTPENAIAAHQQLVGFHQAAEATEFQKTMLERFPDNAKIQAYLGTASDHLGRGEQAVEFYKRALELRPDLPEARVGLARWQIRNGRLDDARKSLDFLEKSGAGQLYSLEPLETLARNYQSRSQHREALQLFEILLRELPKVAEHPVFRKSVKKSEKALGEPRTILPKQAFSLKRWWQFSGPGGRPISSARGLIGFAAVAAIVILGFGISNEYIRHHRKIYLVNGGDAVATVEITEVHRSDTAQASRQSFHAYRGEQEVNLPEGRYHAVISGPVNEELDFDVRDSYFHRWSSSGHVWLINVGGAAILEVVHATYKSQDPEPAVHSFRTGRTFEEFDSVDNIFTPLPEKIQVPAGGSRTLIGLDVFKGNAISVFNYYEEKRRPDDALNFAEQWISSHPDDAVMLGEYRQAAETRNQRARVEQFLRPGLARRPVRIEWHRAYQIFHNHPSDWSMLVDQYEQMLQADPTNSALLYLRGRVEKDRDRACDYFQQAIDRDPKNPFPAYALGYDRMAAADWSGARPFLVRATELNPRDSAFAGMLFTTRLMLGEAPKLEEEWQQPLKKNGADFVAALHLMEAQAAQQKNDEVLKTANNFVRACRAHYGAAGELLENETWYHAFYLTSDFKKMESAAAKDSSEEGKSALTVALLEQGRVDEAVKAFPAQTDDDSKMIFSFAFAAAYHQAGNEDAATKWRTRGMDLLTHGGMDEFQALSLFKRDGAPTRSEAAKLTVSPSLKAVMLLVCAQQYPQAREELAGFARELASGRGFPYHLVQRLASAQ